LFKRNPRWLTFPAEVSADASLLLLLLLLLVEFP